jgi:phosphoribosylformylglycinamidine cyclo-ligase
MDYKNAGVDIEAGYESVELMKKYVKGTMRPEVLGGLGGFSGAFSMEAIKGMEEPVLLSGTDGCGTKVKLAFLLDKHDTIGIDCVAMCVNDVACAGGEPLFFLDYIACGKNYPEKIATIVSGVAEGCKQSGCALIGGETAEHPGLMPEDEYDLAGFTVGVVDKKDIITGENLKAGDVLIGMASTGSTIAEGDVLIGLPSTGVHSNGFSLVRKIFKMDKETLNTYHEELGKTLGEALLAPTRIYVKALKNVKEAGVRVKACSHITGGGFYENVPRMLPEGKHAVIKKDSYEVPAIFKMMEREGNVEEHMMYNTYNMGIGMIVAVDPADVEKTMEAMRAAGDTSYVIGEIKDGEKGVTLC